MSTDSPLTNAEEPESNSQDAGVEGLPPEEAFTEDDGVLYDEEVAPEYGVLGFTLRELLIVGVWLVAFVISFFPLYGGLSTGSIWTQGIEWVQPIGLPTVAVFLVVLRRFSPDGIRRVGSLGIDQFASVAFAFGALYWAMTNAQLMAASIGQSVTLVTWVTIVQLVAALALVALTVFGPLIPGIREDFRGRLVTLAHRNANPVRPVIARPRPERPVSVAVAAPAPADSWASEAAHEPTAPTDDGDEDGTVLEEELSRPNETDPIERLGLVDSVPLTSHASGGELGTDTGVEDSDYIPAYSRSSRRLDESDATNTQPFWALAPTTRDVLDDRGEVVFRIGPDAWALVIEDRGGAYVMRHDDGRIGFLHDIADVTKG